MLEVIKTSEYYANPEKIIEKGLVYLFGQCKEGEWKENFGLRHGETNVWATAFVAHCIDRINAELTKPCVDFLVRKQNSDGGWSFNDSVPSDADSTATALDFLKNKDTPPNPKVIGDGMNFLLSHQHNNGGISTYTQANITKMGYAGRGWSSPHIDVSIKASRVLEGQSRMQAEQFIKSQKRQDGSWRSYWWATDLYPTVQAVEIFNDFSPLTLQYIKSVVPQSAFELALKARGLFLFGDSIEKELADLNNAQEAEGSWPSCPILKIPRPDQEYDGMSRNGMEVVKDNHKLFTTANALLTIHAVLKGGG